MKTLMIFFAVLFLTSDSISQVVINEIMYSPSEATNEWFELHNKASEPVDIRNWKWKDATATLRNITSQNFILQTNDYLIVCQDSLKFKQQFTAFTGKLIQSAWSALNNSGDNLIIMDGSNSRIDSLTFSSGWGGTSGRSLERINPAAPTNNAANWGTTQNPMNGTPGALNSVTPKPFDLSLRSFKATPSFAHPGDTIFFSANVKNAGLNVISNISFRIFFDMNNDSISVPSEQINFQSTAQLHPGDSILFGYMITASDTGMMQYIAMVTSADDDDTTNNTLIQRVKVGLQSSGITGIVINEIMYSPSSSEPEWIEIYNGTSDAVEIQNWKFSDSAGRSNPIIISQISRSIPPGEYLVIAKTNGLTLNHPFLDTGRIIVITSFPTLNNDRDQVFLFDAGQQIVDRVNYHSAWGGNNGHSLERRKSSPDPDDSTAWVTSIDCERSTPGKDNSMSSSVPGEFNDLVINEIMFDPLTGSSEWIEFFNSSSKTILLTGWRLSDASSTYNIADTCIYEISSGEYFLLARDSTIYNSFPELKNSGGLKVSFDNRISLSNEGEPLSLSGVLGEAIDSVHYSGKWHNTNLAETKGISIERISHNHSSNDRRNWSSSASPSGGTPGKVNSIYLTDRPADSELYISPNPFSPDGDGHEDFTEIKFRLNVSYSQMRMKLYDVKGRLVREILNNQYTASNGSVIFDGLGDDGQRLRIGIYIVFAEAVDDKGGTVSVAKAPLVVAGKL